MNPIVKDYMDGEVPMLLHLHVQMKQKFAAIIKDKSISPVDRWDMFYNAPHFLKEHSVTFVHLGLPYNLFADIPLRDSVYLEIDKIVECVVQAHKTKNADTLYRQYNHVYYALHNPAIRKIDPVRLEALLEAVLQRNIATCVYR